MNRWTLDDIPWDRFEAEKVDPHILRVAKAASMVELNGGDYADYLCNVFSGDPAVQRLARDWAQEEVQHGRALGQWACLADPDFDLESAFARFIAGYRLDVEATQSIRGSRVGELVARCIVEVGTSSFYAALGEASEEPVFVEVCRRIAADELRHYRMFYKALKRYLERDNVGRLRRILVALGRIFESEDDELAYAHFAANAEAEETYERQRHADLMASVAYSRYQRKHVDRVVAMTFKAAGLDPQAAWAPWVSRLTYRMVQRRSARSARTLAA